jgi:hypothetical protein
MAWNLLESRSESATRKGGSRDDRDPTRVPTETEATTVGNPPGDPGRLVGESPPHPPGVPAPGADRATDRRLACRPQRDPLPDARRLSVGPTPPRGRPQEHRPRSVPAPLPRGRHATDLGRPRRGPRRAGRGGLAVAECRRLAGQGPVRGGRRRARTPPIAGRWAPRSRWWSMAKGARRGW